MKEDKYENARRGVRESCSIFEEYSQKEMLEAILMNDSKKIQEMRKKALIYKSAVDQFEKTLDEGTDEEKAVAVRTFTMPRVS